MSGMIERVARAHADFAGVPYEADRSFWDGTARAGIAAMREPSVDMLQAATRTENRRDEGPVEVNYMVVACDIWPNMIDAALKVRS